MRNITSTFGTLYHPLKAIVIYNHASDADKHYVEAYDIDSNGYPINAHPLSVRESVALAKRLDSTAERRKGFLKPDGLLPANVLYVDNGRDGFAIWVTDSQQIPLLFSKDLKIPCGKAAVPPLLWKATRDNLYVYALKDADGIDLDTVLYQAPFFNIHDDGRICMGTVDTRIPADCSLNTFMGKWQQYFFNSYFSHLIQNHSPVKSNIIQLWQSLVNTRRKFPLKELLPTRLTIKNLVS
jgi:PRTRC genetic system protein B